MFMKEVAFCEGRFYPENQNFKSSCWLKKRVALICLFRLYPPVTRKRQWRYIWTKPHPLRSCHFRAFRLFLWLLTT